MATPQRIQSLSNAQDRVTSQALENLQIKLDEQRADANGRFDKIDERFTKIDKRITNVEAMFQNLNAVQRNANATTSWSQIEPVWAFRTSGQLGMSYERPSWYPDRGRKLFNLRKERNHRRLISQLRFFDVRGLETWKRDVRDLSDEETDSDSRSSPGDSLEDVVAENSDIGVRALAQIYGVPFEILAMNMEIQENLTNLGAGKESRGIKRHPSPNETLDKRAAQRQPAKSMLKHTPPPRSEDSESEGEIIKLAGIRMSPRMFSSEPRSPQSHVSWRRPLAPPSDRPVIQDYEDIHSHTSSVREPETSAPEDMQRKGPTLSSTQRLSNVPSRTKEGPQSRSIDVGSSQ